MKIVGVMLKHGKTIHIVDNQNTTLCGLPIKDSQMNYSRMPKHKNCKKCLAKVGSIMLADYLGWDYIE